MVHTSPYTYWYAPSHLKGQPSRKSSKVGMHPSCQWKERAKAQIGGHQQGPEGQHTPHDALPVTHIHPPSTLGRLSRLDDSGRNNQNTSIPYQLRNTGIQSSLIYSKCFCSIPPLDLTCRPCIFHNWLLPALSSQHGGSIKLMEGWVWERGRTPRSVHSPPTPRWSPTAAMPTNSLLSLCTPQVRQITPWSIPPSRLREFPASLPLISGILNQFKASHPLNATRRIVLSLDTLYWHKKNSNPLVWQYFERRSKQVCL